MSDLVSQAEIAKRLGIGRQRFQALSRRPDFPPPVASPGGRRIWEWSDVKAWDDARPPDPRRGPRLRNARTVDP